MASPGSSREIIEFVTRIAKTSKNPEEVARAIEVAAAHRAYVEEMEEAERIFMEAGKSAAAALEKREAAWKMTEPQS